METPIIKYVLTFNSQTKNSHIEEPFCSAVRKKKTCRYVVVLRLYETVVKRCISRALLGISPKSFSFAAPPKCLFD